MPGLVCHGITIISKSIDGGGWQRVGATGDVCVLCLHKNDKSPLSSPPLAPSPSLLYRGCRQATMRRLAMLAGAAHAARLAARLGGALPPSPPTPPDPDDLSEEQKLIFSLIAVGLVLLAGEREGRERDGGTGGGGRPNAPAPTCPLQFITRPLPPPLPPPLQASCPASPWACSSWTSSTWRCCAGRAHRASGRRRRALSR